MEFDEWIFKVCENLSRGREIVEIYSTFDLTDAKLAFLDGISWFDYNPF